MRCRTRAVAPTLHPVLDQRAAATTREPGACKRGIYRAGTQVRPAASVEAFVPLGIQAEIEAVVDAPRTPRDHGFADYQRSDDTSVRTERVERNPEPTRADVALREK